MIIVNSHLKACSFAATIDYQSTFILLNLGRKAYTIYLEKLLMEFVLFSTFAGPATNIYMNKL
jgi:hypothetical protein